MSGNATEREHRDPPLWHVPEPHHLWFTGRETTLLTLRERLVSDRVAALTQVPSIFARGGMGKTATARQYVQQHRSKYSHIIWLQAYSVHDLRAEIIQLADRLGWPERPAPDDADLFQAFRLWLAEKQNWLLVLDEVRQPDIAVQLIPPHASGHVLITSRRQDLRALGVKEPLRLESLSEREALEFLLRRTGRDDSDPAETDAARQLAEELGYFPLALELAGAYIAGHFARFRDYLASYRRRRSQDDETGTAAAREYSPEVAVPLELLLEAVTEGSPAASELLRLCSGLRPTGIPWEVFTADSASYPDPLARALAAAGNDPLQRDRLLEPLLRSGLLRRDYGGQTLFMHRVAQAVVWDALSLEDQREAIHRQAEILEYLWNKGSGANSDASSRNLRERLFPQLMTTAKLLTAWSQATPAAAQLLQEVAEEFHSRGRLEDARDWYREVVHAVRQVGGDRHPDLVAVFARLAEIYEQLGERERAIPRLERALDLLENSRPSDDLELVALRVRLAMLYTACGRFDPAANQWEQIVASHERTHPSLAPELLAARERLADLYCSLHKPGYAELLVVRQLALLQQQPAGREIDLIRTRLLLARILQCMGKIPEAERLLLPMRDQPAGDAPVARLQHADILNRLALVTAARGQYAAAEEMLRQTLAIRRELLTPNDPLLAVTCNDLGETCFRYGKFQEAHDLFRSALAIQEPRLARNDPQLIRTRNNLAALLATVGEHASSEKLFLEDLRFKRETLGAEHPHVATTLNNLGVVYGLLKREADEEQMFREALAIRESSFGAVHPQVAQSLSQLAVVWTRQGRYAAAAELLQRALDIRRKLLVPGHPDQAWTMNSLAEIFLLQEIRGLAEPLLEPALELLEKTLDPQNPQVAGVVANLGEAYRLTEQFDRAEMSLQRAITVLDQPDKPTLALVRALVSFGLWERDRSRFDKAQQTLQHALQMQEQLTGSNHPELARILRHLAEVALAREQFAQAEPLLQRALQILKKTKRHPERVACGALLTGLRIALEDHAGGAEQLETTLADAEAASTDAVEPAVLKWLHPLADASFHLQRFELAESLWVRQLELAEREFGPDHLELVAPLKGLAKLYYSQERLIEAEPLLVRCLAINERLRETNHPEVARTVENLAGLYYLQDRFVEAEPLIQRALAYKERVFGRRHAKVADALDNYAALLRKTNRPQQADEYESRAANIRLKHEHILGDLF